MARLLDYRVLTLDCYGTLIDWECGIWDALQPLIMRGGRADVTREAALLAFAQFEHRYQRPSRRGRYRAPPLGCGRNTHCCAPPAQIRTWSLNHPAPTSGD